jgi:ubiquinone/menaquinone biosynthesis C-methylase UbiE
MAEGHSERQPSIAFDQASDYYDRTRVLPPEAMHSVLDLLTRELADRQPCLEIGVGTGRVALPLAERGIRMVGVDLSLQMLGELRRRAGGRPPFPIARADAVRLPFADRSFGAGLAVHVLHLIPAWRDALTELGRVIRRPGVILIDRGGWGTDWWKEVQHRFCREAGIEPRFEGANEAEELDAHMSALGASARMLERIPVTQASTVAEGIDRLEAGLYSFTWRVDEATRRRAAAAVRTWAAEAIGPLDEVRTTSGSIVYRAYDLTGAKRSPGPQPSVPRMPPSRRS